MSDAPAPRCIVVRPLPQIAGIPGTRIGAIEELSMGFPVRIYGSSGSGATFPAIIRVPSKLDDRSVA